MNENICVTTCPTDFVKSVPILNKAHAKKVKVWKHSMKKFQILQKIQNLLYTVKSSFLVATFLQLHISYLYYYNME